MRENVIILTFWVGRRGFQSRKSSMLANTELQAGICMHECVWNFDHHRVFAPRSYFGNHRGSTWRSHIVQQSVSLSLRMRDADYDVSFRSFSRSYMAHNYFMVTSTLKSQIWRRLKCRFFYGPACLSCTSSKFSAEKKSMQRLVAEKEVAENYNVCYSVSHAKQYTDFPSEEKIHENFTAGSTFS